MKTGFKKLFAKKKQNNDSEETATPHDNYTAMNSNSLYSLPAAELVTIIFKFDQEVKSLNKELATTKDQLQSSKSDHSKLHEESVLYKENQETLQLECNRLARELNEAVTSLDSYHAQLDLFKTQLASKEELISSYKSRIFALEKQNCDLQLTSMNLTPGTEGDKLRAKLEESSKQEALLHELMMNNKMLEAEVSKLSSTVSDSKEQLRIWRDKTNIFENARKDTEEELVKVRSEVEELKAEKAKLMFLKESADTENRSLRESVNQKEVRAQKKGAKVESLQKSCSELQQQVSVLKYENEMIRQKFVDDLEVVREKGKTELEALETENKEKFVKLEQEIRELQEKVRAGNEIMGRLSALEVEKSMLGQQLTNTITDLHEKQKKISDLTEEIDKLTNQIEKANKKRELARIEILKLNQKLENFQKSGQSLIEPIVISKTCTRKEMDVLNALKNDLDPLYKSLIGLITVAEKDFYKVKIVDFTSYEKKMNNFVMMLHEQIEDLVVETSVSLKVPQEVQKIVKGRTPIKLFSCISEQPDDTPARLIPKPKRPPQPVDNRMILRRGSAN